MDNKSNQSATGDATLPAACGPNWSWSETSAIGQYKGKQIFRLHSEATISLYGKAKFGKGILNSSSIEGEWCAEQERYRVRSGMIGTNQDADYEFYASAKDAEVRIGLSERRVVGRMSISFGTEKIRLGSTARQFEIRPGGASIEVTETLAPEARGGSGNSEKAIGFGIRLRLRTNLDLGEGMGLLQNDIQSGVLSRTALDTVWEKVGHPLYGTLRIPIL